MLLLGSFAGVLIDRVDRRRALLVTQSLLMLQAATLAVLTATGRIDVRARSSRSRLFLSVVQTFDVVLRQATYVRFVDDRADLAERDRAQLDGGQRGTRGGTGDRRPRCSR